MEQIESEEFIGVQAVHAWTSVPPGTLRNWHNTKNTEAPPSLKFGRRIVYRRADVQAWIEQQEDREAERRAEAS